MKALLAIGLLALLPACTAGDAITARQLTIVDGAAYIQENHDRRRAVRQKLYALEDEMIAKCMDWARAEEITGSLDQAVATAEECRKWILGAYPDLATVELLREGLDNFDRLRDRYPE